MSDARVTELEVMLEAAAEQLKVRREPGMSVC
jgi:hypothetical protein